MKKRILCFGDSNTYGTSPNGGRYDDDVRWTGRLQTLLGSGYTVIEEGFGGRTTVFDDPVEGGYKSGLAYLPPCIMSHNPLDLIIIMLGANDTKQRFGMSARTIGEGCMRLIKTARLYAFNADGLPSKIMLVAPPPIQDWVMQTPYADVFGEKAAPMSRQLAKEYQRYARLMRCEFLDASLYACCSKEDAIHMTPQAHAQLAEAFKNRIVTLL